MLSRREILASTAASLAWRALPAVAQTRRMIVDAQCHMWKAEAPDRPWVPGMKPQLPEPFTVEKLLPLMDAAGVSRVVIVPPSWEGNRNDYGLENAQKYPDRFAVMGRIALDRPETSRPLLPTWKKQKGMLGIRVTFLGPQAAWLKDNTTDWFWPEAEKAGIPVMFLTSGNVKAFLPIAERHPGLPLIADHMGLTAEIVKDGRAGEIIADTVALAKFPNVSVKLSAAPGNSQEAYPYRDMTPHIKKLFDAFGPRRCHWGTDMTNSFAKATYSQRISHFTETLDFLSEDDKDWVMGRSILAKLDWT